MNKTNTNKIILIKLLTSILLSFFLSSLVVAQQNTVSAGGIFSSPTGTVSFSVGQTFYKTYVANNKVSVNEGVQQTYIVLNDQDTTDDNKETALNSKIEIKVLAYPNPTIETLNLFFPINHINSKTSYKIYDMWGRFLQANSIKEEQTIINMNNMKIGTYLIEIVQNNQVVKTFKIIKN